MTVSINQLPLITEINDNDLILVQTENDTNTIKYIDLLDSVVNKDTLNVNKISITENLGVGTSTPLRQVHIKSCTTDYAGRHPLIVEGCTHSVIELRAGDCASTVGIDFGDQELDASGGSHPGSIIYDNSNDKMRIQTNDVDRITILNDGNVGIATSEPNAELAVNGDITATGNIQSDTMSVSGIINSENITKITSHQIDTLSSFEYFEAYVDTDSTITAGNPVNVYKAALDTCGSFNESQAKYTFCNTGYYSVNVNGITDAGSSDCVNMYLVCNNGSDVCIGRIFSAANGASDFAAFSSSSVRLFNKGETLQLEANDTTDIYDHTTEACAVGRWTIALLQRLNG